MSRLVSWTENSNPGVRYFSGTAKYSTSFRAPSRRTVFGQHIFLDLGTVHCLAEVKLNGKPLSLLWAPPYRVDVTPALRSRRNQLEIAVTNEWTDRLIGDRTLPSEKRILSQPPAPTFPGSMSGLPERD